MSGTRLRPVYAVLDDGTQVRQWKNVWYEARFDDDCVFDTDAEGTLRCLPQVSGELGQAYLDDTCQEPLLRITAQRNSPLPTRVAGCRSYGLEQPISGICEVGEALPQDATIFALRSGECVAEPATAHARYHRVIDGVWFHC